MRKISRLRLRFEAPAFSALVAVTAAVVLCLTLFSGQARARGTAVRVGAGVLTEQVLLGEMTRQVLEAGGVEVETHFGLDAEVLRAALLADRLDVYWEYTGQALLVYQKNPDRGVLVDPDRCFQTVSEYDAKLDLVWGRPLPANFTYAVLMTGERARELKISFLSDMAALLPTAQSLTGQTGTKGQPAGQAPAKAAAQAPGGDTGKDAAQAPRGKDGRTPKKTDTQAADQARGKAQQDGQSAADKPARDGDRTNFILALSPDFMERPDGWLVFAAKFGLPRKSPGLVALDPSLMFAGLNEAEVDAVIGPAIDSRMVLFDLVTIPLPQPFFPAYNPAPVWRAETAKLHPGSLEGLERLTAGLTGPVMSRLAWRIEVEHIPVEQVAADWLKQAGLK